ncbi:MAG: hypothetical protein WBP58_15355 [Chitinophagaceae bacterium]
MNEILWQKILEFDLDGPPSEYGFTIRLADENFWTSSFTDQAILEYKKFMYLAATADTMVSPSEIVDQVWHQHLVFTRSYQDFCDLLGKPVQHIPSTQNKGEFEKFRRAKERTMIQYREAFGEPPAAIWEHGSMFDQLGLEKARFKIRTFLIAGLLSAFILAFPLYYILRPLYVNIDNPWFIIGAFIIALVAFSILEIYNRLSLRKIVEGFPRSSFIYSLSPEELVYMKHGDITHVINGTVSQMIDGGIIRVNQDYTLELAGNGLTRTKKELQVSSVLSELGSCFYPELLRILYAKPIFSNVSNCMSAFSKYFYKSKKFGILFYTNFVILILLVLASFTRVFTGLGRDKPVVLILIFSILLLLAVAYFLFRLTLQVSRQTIPALYRSQLLKTEDIESSWWWSYFVYGPSVLAVLFIPVVQYVNRHPNSSDGSGSSCGAGGGGSCGSSCGSSCGGCGGGGD